MIVYPNPKGVRVICDSTDAQTLSEAVGGSLRISRASHIDPLTPLTARDLWQLLLPTRWRLLYLRHRFPNKFVVLWRVRARGRRIPRCVGPFPNKKEAEAYEVECLKTWLSDPAVVLE